MTYQQPSDALLTLHRKTAFRLLFAAKLAAIATLTSFFTHHPYAAAFSAVATAFLILKTYTHARRYSAIANTSPARPNTPPSSHYLSRNAPSKGRGPRPPSRRR